mmetsp:Transcript_2217/g.4962  ORF Transcript_2217/g.4962 Transcript_2217/m.4962 type:complete len:242 (-) Transcript_2217:189-914(-)
MNKLPNKVEAHLTAVLERLRAAQPEGYGQRGVLNLSEHRGRIQESLRKKLKNFVEVLKQNRPPEAPEEASAGTSTGTEGKPEEKTTGQYLEMAVEETKNQAAKLRAFEKEFPYAGPEDWGPDDIPSSLRDSLASVLSLHQLLLPGSATTGMRDRLQEIEAAVKELKTSAQPAPPATVAPESMVEPPPAQAKCKLFEEKKKQWEKTEADLRAQLVKTEAELKAKIAELEEALAMEKAAAEVE